MLKISTVSAALATVLTTTAVAVPTALSVEITEQSVDIPNSVSSDFNPPADVNSHLISALIAASIVLLLIRNQRQSLSKTNFRGKRKVNKRLQSKLLNRLDSDVAERLISSAKRANPGKSEQWYLDKVIYDLNRDRR